MTIPYVLRLLCISLAVFFLMHLAVGAVLVAIAPVASRLACRVRAANAARLLLCLRFMPLVAATFVVLVLCIPSFLWFEPEAGAEEVGWFFLGAAVLGAAVWMVSLSRGVHAAATSMSYVRGCQGVARRQPLAYERMTVWVLDRPEPLLILAGMLRPQLVISQGVIDSLTPGQLAAALEHERAHWSGRDNLKRLALLLAPGLLPFCRGFGPIEKAWARFAEWAADDLAVEGDSLRSVSLAGALVRVARMGVAPPPSLLVSSLLADPQELSARVDRLLGGDIPREMPAIWTAGFLCLSAALVIAALQPATLRAVHHLIERLLH